MQQTRGGLVGDSARQHRWLPSDAAVTSATTRTMHSPCCRALMGDDGMTPGGGRPQQAHLCSFQLGCAMRGRTRRPPALPAGHRHRRKRRRLRRLRAPSPARPIMTSPLTMCSVIVSAARRWGGR
eukprot:scaffold165012_cov27-Prasinocladus_malaysianus.AAC.1